MSLITAIRRKRQYVTTSRLSRLHILVVVVIALFLIMAQLPRTKEKMTIRVIDTNYTYKNLMDDLKNSIIQNEGRLCEIPILNGAPLEMKVKHVPCRDTDWVQCVLDECSVVDEIRNSTKVLFCIYQDMFYVDEYRYDLGKPVTLPGNVNYKLRKSDHVKVSCNGIRLRDQRWPFPQLILDILTSDSSSLTQEIQWLGYKAGFRRLPPLDPPISGPGLNILILGLNCMSNKAFVRQMKESYAVLQQMGAVFLDGYNTVGEGISAALFPIFSGKSELQFPEESDDLKKTSSIFKHLSNSGYRTAFFMDSIDDFQRSFKDFNEIPDHYLFPLLLEAYKSRSLENNLNICMGTKPLYKLMLGLTYQFFQQPGNRFSFTYMGSTCNEEFSMNYAVDPYLANFLRHIQKDGRLKNTVLLIMGNHGPKYGTFHEYGQSRLEKRLPFMAIVAKDGLKRTRSEGAWEALKANAKVLTTPFDIHSTLVDILGMGHLKNQEKIPMVSMPRGMTLLQPIPKTRTCGEAGVLPHWCACINKKVDVSEPNYLKVSVAIAKYINNITRDYRKFCKKRQLTSIVTVERYFSHEHIGKVRSMGELYQAVIKMSPDLAFFEATLTYFENGNYFEINPRHVARLSAPGDTADCIKRNYPHLIDYCYCINQIVDDYITRF